MPSTPTLNGYVSNDEGPSCTIVRPTTLGETCDRHPVILWGNGTGSTPTVYSEAFDLWASHGFIVAAAQTTDAGSGTEMLDCLDWLQAQNDTADSTYEGHVAANHAGATGHSQGGGGALMSGQDERVITTAPVQPYTQQGFGGFDQASFDAQTGPMLLLSGTADTIATPEANQRPVFEATNVPVFWANLIGADHVSVAFGLPTYREVMLAWFRIHLMEDRAFRSMFYGDPCDLCDDADWEVERRGF